MNTNETISCIELQSGLLKVVSPTGLSHVQTITKKGDIDTAKAASHWKRASPTTSEAEIQREESPLSTPTIMKIGDINTNNSPLHWRRGKSTEEN